jgi:hypothetical protein
MSQTNQESGATDASKTETTFLGKCVPKANPDPNATPENEGVATTLPDGKTEVKGNIAWWYDEADDWRITGKSLWKGNFLWDGAPMASPAEVWGTAELFVDAKDPNNSPVGRWELSFLGDMKQTLEGGFELIVEVVGSGKEGVAQGLSAKSIYTFDFAKHTYKTEGFIS